MNYRPTLLSLKGEFNNRAQLVPIKVSRGSNSFYFIHRWNYNLWDGRQWTINFMRSGGVASGSSNNNDNCTHPVALAGVFLHPVGQAFDQTPQHTFILCGNGGEKIWASRFWGDPYLHVVRKVLLIICKERYHWVFPPLQPSCCHAALNKFHPLNLLTFYKGEVKKFLLRQTQTTPPSPLPAFLMLISLARCYFLRLHLPEIIPVCPDGTYGIGSPNTSLQACSSWCLWQCPASLILLALLCYTFIKGLVGHMHALVYVNH